jgi:Family of unknown function (DUF5947)
MDAPLNTRTFETLRSFTRRKKPLERCELCSQEIGPQHDHLVDPSTNKLTCACTACAILFTSQNSGGYRRVPREVHFLADFQMSDAQWDSLRLPIDLAFFFSSSVENRTRAFYPGPAGVTESLLPLDTWSDIVAGNPILRGLRPDVEALLVNRARRSTSAGVPEYFILPIDECYRLVGQIRTEWHGLSGGADVWRGITGFFDEMKKRSERPGRRA